MTVPSTQPVEGDGFIAIAAREEKDARDALVRLPASPWPENDLPLEPGREAWAAAAEPEAAPAWDALLAGQRERVKPFLRNFAPEPAVLRTVRPIERFFWRMEEEADLTDFSRVLSGDGDWAEVTVPHFGGPTGRATAYYRQTFVADDALLARPSVAACFDAVDYVAEVYLNGRLVVRHEGFFAPFEAELRPYLVSGENTLVVAVHNDGLHRGDGTFAHPIGEKVFAATGPGWDEPGTGWHHCPPGMGIPQAVRIEGRDRLHLSDLFVRTLPGRDEVEVRVEVTYRDTAIPQLGAFTPCTLELSVDGGNFDSPGVVPPKRIEVRDAGPNANEYRIKLPLPDARLWSPDTPWLYRLTARVFDDEHRDAPCDVRAIDFGVRTFTQDLDGEPRGRFYLNGHEVRLRGANTMGHEQQAVMAGDDGLLLKDLLIAKAANLNYLRLTQRPVQRRVYEMADRVGLMIQSDLPLFGYLRRPQACEVIRQAAEMERLVRRHPCVVQCSYINEPFPTPEDPETGEGTRQLTRPELESTFVAMTQVVRHANPERVVKPMDGDYHPPGPGQPDNHCYTLWYNGHGLAFHEFYAGRWQPTKPGWMMACNEYGAEGLDHVDLMRRRYPEGWLPGDADPAAWTPWQVHRSQTPKMQPMFFPRPTGIEAWVEASQSWQAEAVRLMSEGLRRIERINTTAIHLLIDAWPAGWMKALVDCERNPKPAFWAYREAMTPLNAHPTLERKSYTSGETLDAAVWLCSDLAEDTADVELVYAVTVGDETVASGSVCSGIDALRSRAIGAVRCVLPESDEIRRGAVRVRRVVEGRYVSETSESFTLWPVCPPRGSGRGVDEGPTATLRIHADGRPLDAQAHGSLETHIRRGGTAVVFGLPEGTHELPGGPVSVASFSLGGAVFVEPAADHPAIAGLPADACFAWHHPDQGVFAELCRTVVRDDAGWSPILRGVGGAFWQGEYFEAYAAAERRVGAGRLILCQVDLDQFAATNPAARRLNAALGVEHAATASPAF
ncbi:MAG: sugar-binding domain-containing protein [Planctomycetota bacterium]